MSKQAIFPWKDRDEFCQIFDALFSCDPTIQKQALERIRVWAARNNKLPIAIESTRDLVDARLAGRPETVQSESTLAIIRMVNIHTEPLQKGLKSAKVHELAEKIGIQKWVVDIRHEGTHNKKPDATRVEGAVRFCLDWLKEKFWLPQMEAMENNYTDGELDNNTKKKIMDAVKSYCEAKYSAVPNGEHMEMATDHEKPEQVFEQLKKKLRQTSAKEYLAYLLVSSYGYLIPNTEQRQKLGVVDDNFNGEKGIPGPVLAVWTPVLYYLCSTINLDLVPVLVNSIVEKLNTLAKRQGPESEDAVFISYLKGWAKELIKREQSPAEENDGPEKRGEKFRRGKRLWKTAVKTCLQRPHEQTEAIFKSLLPLATDSCVNGSGQELVNLFTLMARGPNGSTLLQNSANRLDIERLLEAQSPTYLNGQSAEPPVLEEREGLEPWSVSTAPLDWSRVPLGAELKRQCNPNFFRRSKEPPEKRQRRDSPSEAPGSLQNGVF